MVFQRALPPVRGARGSKTPWTFLLNPQEDQVPSKVGSFDDSIPLDLDSQKFFGPILADRKSSHRDSDTITGVPLPELAKNFTTAANSAGYKNYGLVLYQFRHIGASKDRVKLLRPLPEVEKRGRWGSDSSVARYEKGGRVGQMLGDLSDAARQHAVRCAGRITSVLGGSPVQ